MRHRPSARAVATLLTVAVAAVAVAGCTRPALSRQAYRDRAKAICDRAKAAQAAALATAGRGDPLSALRELRAVNRRMTNGIARLDPPLGTDHSHDRAIAIGVATDRTIGRVTAEVKRTGDPARALRVRAAELQRSGASADHRWARLHLAGCAGGPAAALGRLPATAR